MSSLVKRIKASPYLVAEGIFGRDRLWQAYRHFRRGGKPDNSLSGRILYFLLSRLSRVVDIDHIKGFVADAINLVPDNYEKTRLGLMTHRIHNPPEVIITSDRKPTVNVLIPAFTLQTISAGFFGVFQVALKISRMGYHVRLVMFDNFNYDEVEFRAKMLSTTGLETLLEEVEVVYIGDRYKPLRISSQDTCVATVWYSAYFAEKIAKMTGNKPFLYLIQDYESAFYAFSALYAFADSTYSKMNYHGLISSQPLLNYLDVNKKCGNNFAEKKMTFFNNACAAREISSETFIKRKDSKARKFIFYSRPTVDRNMFPLASLAIIEAFKQGIFDDGHNWELYGMGIGNVGIYLDGRTKLEQMPRMSLKEYEVAVQSFDVCLTLMASPHPSLIPFDLAGGGAIVVTNVFATKTADYFAEISKNIIAVEPTVDDIVDAIRKAVHRSQDFETRYAEAIKMAYPRSWDQTWSKNIEEFIDNSISQSISEDNQQNTTIRLVPRVS